MHTSPLGYFWDGLTWLTQASPLIPLAFWLYRRQLRAALLPLVLYAGLSLGNNILGYLLAPPLQPWRDIAFYLLKAILLATAYYQGLHRPTARYSVAGLAIALIFSTLAGIIPPDDAHLHWAASYARLGQCAVLASFALTYLEQLLSTTTVFDLSRDPLFLLSVGQLLYSALTVGFFSLLSRPTTEMTAEIGAGLLTLGRIIFLTFLTLAIYYGNRASPPATPSN